ncbi:MAG: DUF2442 domain-containing protein [Okeania sp. SIO2H7]|nr:DUF2442 domain-containing protein [Okeania sp. SIO2H7]
MVVHNKAETRRLQIEKARAAAQPHEAVHPRVVSAQYENDKCKITVHFSNGMEFSFPPVLAQGLVDATPEQLAEVEVSASGMGLRWDSLDVDLLVDKLMLGFLGTKAWMQQMGQKGGQSTSEAKASAARKNGKKGGRPKKKAVAK